MSYLYEEEQEREFDPEIIEDENQQEDQEDYCYDHDYEFQESLPSGLDTFQQELWFCIYCGREKVATHSIGVRDDKKCRLSQLNY